MKVTIALLMNENIKISYEIARENNHDCVIANYADRAEPISYYCFSLQDAIHFLAWAVNKALRKGDWKVVDVEA